MTHEFREFYRKAKTGRDMDEAIDEHLTEAEQKTLYTALTIVDEFTGIDFRQAYLQECLRGRQAS